MAEDKLAEMLCARLCHDLVSPVGAISNGAEMLADEDDENFRREAIQLMSDSALEVARRLQFYRLAFGGMGGASDMIAVSKLHDVTSEFFRGGKVDLGWRVSAENIDLRAAKLLLNMILIARDALVRGGNIEVRIDDAGGLSQIVIAATGNVVQIRDGVQAALSPRPLPGEPDSQSAPAYLARHLAGQLDGTLGVEWHGDTRVLFSARFRAL